MNSTDIVWDRDAYLSLGRKLKVQIWLFIVIFFFTFCWSVKATALLFRARYIKYRGLKLTNGLDSTEIVAISTLAAATCELFEWPKNKNNKECKKLDFFCPCWHQRFALLFFLSSSISMVSWLSKIFWLSFFVIWIGVSSIYTQITSDFGEY